MKEYDFGLIFELEDSKINPEIYLGLLYEAGCDDALIGTGKLGFLSLDFIRESGSACEAVKSAIHNVKSVLPRAKLIHISPDLVGVKELVDILKCSRQNVQNFINKSTFPSSVYKGSQAIWHLADVLKWFVANNHNIKEELLELAELTKQTNVQIENKTVEPNILAQAKNLVAI